jgi:hypothetical protein
MRFQSHRSSSSSALTATCLQSDANVQFNLAANQKVTAQLLVSIKRKGHPGNRMAFSSRENSSNGG